LFLISRSVRASRVEAKGEAANRRQKTSIYIDKDNAENGFKQLDVRRRCCDTRAILRFGLAALKDGLYIEKARKSRFLGQKPPFGMTVCGVSGSIG